MTLRNEKCWKVDLSRQKWMVWKEHPISFAAKMCVLVPSITPSGDTDRNIVVAMIGFGGVERHEKSMLRKVIQSQVAAQA